MLVNRILAQLLCFHLFFLGTSAFAQYEPGQWVAELYSLIKINNSPDGANFDYVLIDGYDKIRKVIPNLAKSKDPGLPPPRFRSLSHYAYWWNDALYTYANGARIKNMGDGFPITPYTFAKWQDGKWQYLGHHKVNALEELIEAIPCDNDKFIIVTLGADRTRGNPREWTPFSRFSLPKSLHQDESAENVEDKEEAFFSPASSLKLESTIDHGMDNLRPYMGRSDIFKLAWLSNVIMTDHHATLINYSTGLYWVFSLEKASLVKAGNIFKGVTTEMILKGGFPRAVLCANPEKDGTILLAAQEESFFIKETSNPRKDIEEFKKQYPTATEEEIEKIRKRLELEWRRRNPLITWYRIYPENGRVEILKAPPMGADVLRDEDGFATFRPYADGSVKMPFGNSNLSTIEEKPPKSQEKHDVKDPADEKAAKEADAISKEIAQNDGSAQKVSKNTTQSQTKT